MTFSWGLEDFFLRLQKINLLLTSPLFSQRSPDTDLSHIVLFHLTQTSFPPEPTANYPCSHYKCYCMQFKSWSSCFEEKREKSPQCIFQSCKAGGQRTARNDFHSLFMPREGPENSNSMARLLQSVLLESANTLQWPVDSTNKVSWVLLVMIADMTGSRRSRGPCAKIESGGVGVLSGEDAHER